MNDLNKIDFIDHEAANDSFICIDVDLKRVVESWRDSVFSYQWMTPEGEIKSLDDLSDQNKDRKMAVERAINESGSVKKPVLGLGMQDHVEIGSGHAELLTLAALGYTSMPVHIPKSNLDDFEKFLTKN